MAVVDVIQHSFTRGVISKNLASRTDLEFYNKALYAAKNVVILPQGAIRNRWGSDYVTKLDSGAIIACEYKYTIDKKFLIVFTDETIRIYLDDVLKKTITGTPYTESVISSRYIKTTSTQDGLIIVSNGSIETKILTRGADDSTWTLSAFTLKNPPSYDFKKDYYAKRFTLSSLSVGESTLRCNSSVFTTLNVGGFFSGPGDKDFLEEGFANIKEYVSATEVKVSVIQAFSDQFNYAGGVGVGTLGDQCVLTENAFNSTYGYPTCVTYFDGRLYFAATPSLPSTIFGSNVNEPYNFALGSGLATEGLSLRISDKEFIMNIVGDLSLQVFTDDEEHATIQQNNGNIAPGKGSILRVGTFGSTVSLPVSCDNQTFFIRAKGSGLGALAFNGDSSSYKSIPVSLFASDLISSPVCLATYKGQGLTDSNYVFIVNDDGTMAIYQTLSDENISAFFSANLEGQSPDGVDDPSYKYVTAVGDDLYIIVERTVEGNTYNYIEKVNFDSNFDSSITISSDTAFTEVTGLSHLEGLTVKVKADGYLLKDEVVSGDSITITRSAKSVEVGLWSPSYIEMLPVTANLQTGNNRYSNRRVNEFIVDYVDTCPSSLKSNGMTFPEEPFYDAMPYDPVDQRTVTGQYTVSNVAGWDINDRIVIEQAYPYDFNIIAVCSKLGV